MNYHSKGVIPVRIFVKDFVADQAAWTLFRTERVASALSNPHYVSCYDWKTAEHRVVAVFVQELDSLERVPIYELTNKQIANCLENVSLTADFGVY